MSTIDDLLQRLRIAGGDTTEIEVNSCAGGLAQSILPSLCSLANLPGGGWLILGLDENAGFKPVQLGDLQALKQGVAGKARACTPPVVVSFEDAQVEGLPVILARVAECTPSLNPCRVTSTGVAWALVGWGLHHVEPGGDRVPRPTHTARVRSGARGARHD